ncbi:FAD-dependent oxidoreductase [Thalassobius sp. MITS945101]|uniref:FAD-dependent oxidoreductase n=1 Tax=Thalassobius sp. MITS945101 TaxID=3096994 RepID=UPI00399A73D0
MKRVAIVGAGLTGTITALCLSEAGIAVDLYDRHDAPLLGASGTNEGKIHLGYVYAMAPTPLTAETMLLGANSFRTVLSRWLKASVFDAHISDPFLYAVPKTSMLSVEAIRFHFAKVSEQARYLAPMAMTSHNTRPRELSRAELAEMFDPDQITTCFETDEVAIDPLVVRAGLSGALNTAPRLTQRYKTSITAIQEGQAGYQLTGSYEGLTFTERYDAVVNATWHQRLKLDASFGLTSARLAIHRYKCGLRTTDIEIAKHLLPVTFIVGEYGDTVSYGDTGFVSWYPSGLLSQETGLHPKLDDIRLTLEQNNHLIENTLQNLHRFMPGAGKALTSDPGKWEVVGGYISAWGDRGIEHSDSELHGRYDVGVYSSGNYHSVDTGKYTLAPLFAAETAARILA